jgi:hypothetical protein
MAYIFPGFMIRPDHNQNQNTLTIGANQTAVDDVAVTTVAQTISVPTDASGNYPKVVNFSGSGNFYVNFSGGAATVPNANVTGGGGSILNPGARSIVGITSFSIICPVACVVSLEWYS